MIENAIPVNEPELGDRERELILQCFETGWISSDGPFVGEFERAFATLVNRKYGVAVTNGSAALDAAVAALELKPGDEVIMPSFTIISCASAILRAGAIPVPVDCDPDTWNMTPEAVFAAKSSRTRAIMIVHIYGLPVDVDPILEFARKHDLYVIEDAAEAHGLLYKGRPCGSFGDVSTFSFYPNKHVTTGEGGMIVTNNPDIAARCRSLRNLCFQPERRFVHEELGWNLRMSNLQAAVGLGQLDRLPSVVAQKRKMGQTYRECLGNISQLQLPLEKVVGAENIYWVSGLVLSNDLSFDAEEMMRRLAERGIGTRPFFFPMHEQPVLKRMGLFKNVSCPTAERLARRGFYVPSGVKLTTSQMERVGVAIRECLT